MSTRGDYAARALLSLALHGVRPPDVGEGDRGAHQPPPAVPRADPARGEGRGARALEARRRRRLRARPAARGDHARPDPRRGRRPAHHARSASTTTARATASCRRSGSASPRRWAAPRAATRSPISSTRHAGRPPRRARRRRRLTRPRRRGRRRSPSRRGSSAVEVVGGERLLDAQPRSPVTGWANASVGRVQERPVERDRGSRARRTTGSPTHRVADRREVHADLVGAPGLEPALEQARRRVVERARPPRSAVRASPAAGAHRHARRRRAPSGRSARRSTPLRGVG